MRNSLILTLGALLVSSCGAADTEQPSSLLALSTEPAIQGEWQLEPAAAGRIFNGDAFAESGSLVLEADGRFMMTVELRIGDFEESAVIVLAAEGTWRIESEQLSLIPAHTDGHVIEVSGPPNLRARAEQRVAQSLEQSNARRRTETYAVEALTDEQLVLVGRNATMTLHRVSAS